MLSILIPTYNDDCSSLVDNLVRQADKAGLSDWEIIVADDGSTDMPTRQSNSQIAKHTHCIYIERPTNSGRAAIRNFLAQSAHGDWLLFIDADMSLVDDHYLEKYLQMTSHADVVYGGYVIVNGDKSNLRYLYEKQSEPSHTLEYRKMRPYQDFHTSNFMIRRDIMLRHPLDSRFRHYGYEDVFFGRQLQEAGIAITHIDAPVGFGKFEDNAHFLAKTEEGLQTLSRFRLELKGYSRLLRLARYMESKRARAYADILFKLLRRPLRHNLLSKHPSLLAFKIYKLGYFLSL